MPYHIKTFNVIAKEGLNILDNEHYKLNETDTPDGIVLRSQNLHDYPFNKELQAIVRAGAGTNNVPVDECTEKGIVVCNTPGANANAVKELVLASLLLSARPIIKGASWVQELHGDNIEQQVEAEKKQFAGSELIGKKLGVIGLGAIGGMIANDAYRLGMEVTGYDPFVSVNTAWNLSRRVKKATSIEEILANSDYITIHVPLNEKNNSLIGEKELAMMKPTTTVLNFSRCALVDVPAVINAVQQRKINAYFTDFAHESLLHQENITVLPHLGSSTEEAEINCAKMATKTLRQFLETGNIQNSVNFPEVKLSFNSPFRIAIVHKNVPNMLGTISSTAATLGVNIDNLINKSRGDIAYTLLDTTDNDADIANAVAEKIATLDNVIRVRAIKNLEWEV